jgi:glycosyltransferase involved in cell wall biosynthesis
MNKPFLSIAIPAYGYEGKGVEYLEFNFDIIKLQTFKDFEVVVSDHSVDDTIKDVCIEYENDLKIKYIRNEKGRGIISPNLNVAMENCSGKWIKILFQDDFLYDENSLQIQYDFIVNNINLKWFGTKFYHSNDGKTFYHLYIPHWNERIWAGNNTIGCPSGITLKNKDLLFFDEGLNWLVDVEYYKRMKDRFGVPYFLNEITYVNRTHGNGLSNTTSKELINKEHHILNSRYA